MKHFLRLFRFSPLVVLSRCMVFSKSKSQFCVSGYPGTKGDKGDRGDSVIQFFILFLVYDFSNFCSCKNVIFPRSIVK